MRSLIILITLALLVSGCIDTIPTDPNTDPDPSLDPSGQTPPASAVRFFELEDVAGSGFEARTDVRASAGSYLHVGPVGSVHTTGIALDGYRFLAVRMYGPSPSEDAVILEADAFTRRVYPSEPGVYEWIIVELTDARGSLVLRSTEPNVRLDALVLSVDALSIAALDDVLTIDPSVLPEAGDDPSSPPVIEEPSDEESGVRAPMSLRGDPSFSSDDLSPLARERYDAFWYALENAEPNLESQSTSANMYNYGRGLFIGLSMAEMVFRQTGDLELLDEMYELSKNTYDLLEDRWDSEAGESYYYSHIGKTIYAQDGYRNWRYRKGCGTGTSEDIIYCGRDNHRLEEALSHGMAAGVMYALHVNRDLESPKGYDYGAMADAWLDYLRSDFEAKWREWYNRPWPQMPYFTRHYTHTNMAHLKTHYYVGRMLEDLGDPDAQVYLAEAQKMTDQIFEEPHVPSGSGEQAGGFVETQTPIGPAYIWAFGTPYSTGTAALQAAPTTYARYFLAMVAQLHFDGAYRFEDPAVMEMLSRTVAQFVLNTDPPYTSTTLVLAADVIGGGGDGAKVIEGIQGTTYRQPNNANRYAVSTFGLYALWDDTGRIDEITEAVYTTASSRTRRMPLNAFRFISVYEDE